MSEKPSPVLAILQIGFMVLTFPLWKWAFIILFAMCMTGWHMMLQ